jgi:hypothetical protein
MEGLPVTDAMATKPDPKKTAKAKTGKEAQSQVQRDFARSNATVKIDVPICPVVRWAAKRMQQALAERDAPRVAAASMAFIDALCEKVDLPFIPVKVAPRLKRVGRAEFHGRAVPKSITVYLRTTRKGRFVAFRTYLRTLCHEFCHHYDWMALKLNRSFHTKGFYQRLDQINQGVLDALKDS